MSKYLKLSFVAFLVVCSFGIILSCSESDDGKSNVEDIPYREDMHSPSWLQGDWHSVEEPDRILFKINKDEIYLKVGTEDGKSKLMNVLDFVKAQHKEYGVVIELQEGNYYRVKFYDKQNTRAGIFAVFDFTPMENGNVRYCPVNTQRVKEYKELEGCVELVRNK